MIWAITDPMRTPAVLEAYTSWIKRYVPETEVRVLSFAGDRRGIPADCQALVLTGGGDVHPKFYGRPEAVTMANEIHEERDRFEIAVIREAVERSLPVLGICRGTQVFNVAMGGTLIADIESAGFPSHRKGEKGQRTHGVTVEKGSLLHETVTVERGEVNTSHHQAVETPGEGLRVTGRSPDGIVEALEWERRDERPFLLLVQWHPERVTEEGDVFSGNIISRFAREVKRHAST
jgi:putative glutamine amidotransferase